MPSISGPKGTYEIGGLEGESDRYRVYVCRHVETNTDGLLIVAKHIRHNGDLSHSVWVLGQLAEESRLVEEEFVPHRQYEEHRLNYDFGFPTVFNSFKLKNQGNRLVVFMTFRATEDISLLEPAARVRAKERVRIDMKTSAWILGKALKTLVLAHSMGISHGRLDLTKILIHRDGHYCILFDWSDAQTHTDGVPPEVVREEIKGLARGVISLLDGNPDERSMPIPGNEDGFEVYSQFLFHLAAGGEADAHSAHKGFYAMVKSIWGRRFHPWTTYGLDNRS